MRIVQIAVTAELEGSYDIVGLGDNGVVYRVAEKIDPKVREKFTNHFAVGQPGRVSREQFFSPGQTMGWEIVVTPNQFSKKVYHPEDPENPDNKKGS